jgi:putative Mg2+ transporter-C (MgtC) family protein
MVITSLAWSFPELLRYFGPRFLFAILCGGLIGLERELKNKSAGLKTNMLICLGSTLFTSMSVLIAASFAEKGHYGDPSRVAAQIVSGIGFLGGGAILQSRGAVVGLTTAATIWVVAAIGVCIGIGHIDVAVFCALIVVLVLVTTTAFERRILGRVFPFSCEVVAEDRDGQIKAVIDQALSHNNLVISDFTIRAKDQFTLLIVHYNGIRNNHKKFILELWKIPSIREVKHS